MEVTTISAQRLRCVTQSIFNTIGTFSKHARDVLLPKLQMRFPPPTIAHCMINPGAAMPLCRYPYCAEKVKVQADQESAHFYAETTRFPLLLRPMTQTQS